MSFKNNVFEVSFVQCFVGLWGFSMVFIGFCMMCSDVFAFDDAFFYSGFPIFL